MMRTDIDPTSREIARLIQGVDYYTVSEHMWLIRERFTHRIVLNRYSDGSSAGYVKKDSWPFIQNFLNEGGFVNKNQTNKRSMDIQYKVALIGGGFLIVGAIITGLFTLLGSKDTISIKDSHDKTAIDNSQNSHNSFTDNSQHTTIVRPIVEQSLPKLHLIAEKHDAENSEFVTKVILKNPRNEPTVGVNFTVYFNKPIKEVSWQSENMGTLNQYHQAADNMSFSYSCNTLPKEGLEFTVHSSTPIKCRWEGIIVDGKHL